MEKIQDGLWNVHENLLQSQALPWSKKQQKLN